MKIRIDVTREDILIGSTRNQVWCPIALAVKRCTGWGNARVRPRFIQHGFDTIPMPQEAVDFVIKFDNQEPVEPFSFEIGAFA